MVAPLKSSGSSEKQGNGTKRVMSGHLFFAAIASVIAFAAVVLMTDRKRGANVAWSILLGGGALAFTAIVFGSLPGMNAREVAGFSAALLAAGAASMLYHFFLGRFERVWTARGVLTVVFLGFWLVIGIAIPKGQD